MLYKILPEKINRFILSVDPNEIMEIRLTSSCRAHLIADKKNYYSNFRVNFSDIEYVLARVTKNSLYAVNDTLVKGFVPYDNGIRVGVAGEYVYVDGKVKTIKNINSIVIRVPNAKTGIADSIINKIYDGTKIKNTLFVGPPLSGKTTMLREIARLLSVKMELKVVIIDEKNEISATNNGTSYLDVGESVVSVGVNRFDGIENAIRNLSPQIIITDEIYGDKDKESVERCLQSGVAMITSKHGGYKKDSITNLFDYQIGLSSSPVGRIEWEIIND